MREQHSLGRAHVVFTYPLSREKLRDHHLAALLLYFPKMHNVDAVFYSALLLYGFIIIYVNPHQVSNTGPAIQ